MDEKKRDAILRLILAAIVLVLVVVGIVVLVTTGWPVVIAVAIVALLINSLVWLPADIRNFRELLHPPADQQH